MADTDKKSRILVVDDDASIVQAIRIYLEEEGFEVFPAYTGREALQILDTLTPLPDLLILDIMMPELDGLRTLQRLRQKYNLPVLLLSAKSEEQDKIAGLNLGADDYLTKPFSAKELLARVKAQLRRYTVLGPREESGRIYKSGGLELDEQQGICTVNQQPVYLTTSEFRILAFLLKNKGKVFSSSAIYEAVWKTESYGGENVVSVHICHIREKIEASPRNPIYLKVVWGRGYMIEDLDGE